ncbi:MAG: ribosome assembly RNA-binding protein YhbY [Lachnospiraceae bacterium]|nr:ribosome assembly RNA-binding protein YhbY [Lachnospiraceae bacterium]
MTGKERAKYRAEANGLEPVFQIGKGGVTEAVLSQVEDALDARELIKVKALLETIPESPKEMAQKIAARTKADVIQVIGGAIVLYRENPELRQAEKEKEKRKKEIAKKHREKERMQANAGKRAPRAYDVRGKK